MKETLWRYFGRPAIAAVLVLVAAATVVILIFDLAGGLYIR